MRTGERTNLPIRLPTAPSTPADRGLRTHLDELVLAILLIEDVDVSVQV